MNKAVQGKPGRLDALDILKALCIFMVVLTHCEFTAEDRTRLLFPFWVDMAVPLFMVISGFTYSLSSEKRGMSSVLEWFETKNFRAKFTRIVGPFLAVFAVETVFFSGKIAANGPLWWLERFLGGGIGPGSYYVPVLCQLLICFPFMFLAFKKSPLLCAFALCLLNLVFEAAMGAFSFSIDFYALSFCRYFTFVLMGMFLFFYREKLRGTLVPHICLASGLIYILVANYLNYNPVFFTRWKTTAMPVAPYAFAVVYWGLAAQGALMSLPSPLLKPLLYIGKASLHIFLVQKFYYSTPWQYAFSDYGFGAYAASSLVICVSAGCLFYFLYEKAHCRVAGWYKKRS